MEIKKSNLNKFGKAKLGELMLTISNDVADTIAPTYGPYGANTLIQSVDTVYATKDGWTVLQNLNYPYNGIYNGLKKLIQDCAQSVLLKIGDGTTTVTLLSNSIYKKIYKEILCGDTAYNVKTLESALQTIVDVVSEELMRAATRIEDNDDDLRRVIYDIAAISTNWDTEMADFIADIYCKTKNPIIKFENSGTEKSYVEYITGYDIKGRLILPNFYRTDNESGKCVIKNPAVLMFNYAVGKDMVNMLTLIAETFLAAEGRTLVVIAPDFVPDFVNGLQSINMTRLRANRGIVTCVPFKYNKNMTIDNDCAEDLCVLLGTDMIAKENTDMSELFMDVQNALTDRARLKHMTSVDPEEEASIIQRADDIMKAAREYLSTIAGTCDEIVATDKYILAKGLTNANTNMFEDRKAALKCELELKTKECAALSMITEGIRMKRIRLGKMQLNMGVIYVGGFGDANLKAKRDALDDATRACESVYYDGYTKGGGIATLIALTNLKLLQDNKYDECVTKLAMIIAQSYMDVQFIMYNNKFCGTQDDRITEIIREAVNSKKPFNLITEEFDDSIITPVNGEIEILKGVMSLISVMVGANQMVFHDINSIEDAQRVAAVEECGDLSMETQTVLLKNQ